MGACCRDRVCLCANCVCNAIVGEAGAADLWDAGLAGVAAHHLSQGVVAWRFVRRAHSIDFAVEHECRGCPEPRVEFKNGRCAVSTRASKCRMERAARWAGGRVGGRVGEMVKTEVRGCGRRGGAEVKGL